MTFPTAEQQASFASWLGLTGIASSVGSARPDLAEAVTVQDERALHLTIALPHTPGEYQTQVVVAEVVMGIVRQWMVGAPGNPVISTFWTLGTATDVLAEAALQSWDCSVAGIPLPSPWKWSESERSEAVDLADRLVAEGLPVTAVAAMNPGNTGARRRTQAGMRRPAAGRGRSGCLRRHGGAPAPHTRRRLDHRSGRPDTAGSSVVHVHDRDSDRSPAMTAHRPMTSVHGRDSCRAGRMVV